MATILASIDEPKLKRLAGNEWYVEGEKLAAAGVVDLIEVTPLKVKAQVKDATSQSYVEVKLVAAMGRLIFTCTCDQTGFCPHCVAAALTTSKQAAIKRSEDHLQDGQAAV